MLEKPISGSFDTFLVLIAVLGGLIIPIELLKEMCFGFICQCQFLAYY